MKRIIVFSLLVLPFVARPQSSQTYQPIDSILTYLHDRHLFSGVALVAEEGQIVYQKALGWSNAQSGKPLNIQSAFNLASISKQFYAMMVMMLQEQGKLDYDDPVQKHLDDFPYPAITIRQIMNQVSGLPEYFEMAARDMNLADTLTNAHLLQLLKQNKPPLVFEPGEEWQYSNTNYTTLASLIEAVSGEPVDQFFKANITTPLGLQNTYVYNLKLGEAPASRVFGFRYEGGKIVKNDLVRFDGIIGDGNIYSSAEDLLKWDQALYTEKLVKTSTFQEAITPAKLNNGEATTYGFGWFISEEGKVVSHTGGWVGFRNLLVRYLEDNRTLVVLSNGSNARGMRLVKNFLEGKPWRLPQTEIISNVQIVDGSGLPAFKADVRIVDNRIQEVGKLPVAPGEPHTNGQGLTLAPGFIDSHSHHDWGLKENPSCIAATNQGVTTIVVGQDGGSNPMDSLAAQLKAQPISVNIASFTGHSSIRSKAMDGDVLRKAKPGEIEAMKALLEEELKKGSLGLSSGLEYEAAFYSNTAEVIELAKVAAKHKGTYLSHIRSEDVYQDEAIGEIIDIGREAKLPVQITHIKIAQRSRWGSSSSLLQLLQRVRQQGIDISADVYPYTMWSSTPRVLFPKKDFQSLASAQFATEELFDPAASVMVNFPANRAFEGKTITEIGQMNEEGEAEALLRIIREGEKTGESGAIVATSMSEQDIANFLRWEHTSICSDGAMRGHPRGHGAFTRVLGRYVRELGVLSLPSAIHKMTGLPAEKLGIRNRGLITPGYFADLVLFDPETVQDNASIQSPSALSSGIRRVWVNGQAVYDKGEATKTHPGMLIKR